MLEQCAHLRRSKSLLLQRLQCRGVHQFVQNVALGRRRPEQRCRIGLRIVGRGVLALAGIELPALRLADSNTRGKIHLLKQLRQLTIERIARSIGDELQDFCRAFAFGGHAVDGFVGRSDSAVVGLVEERRSGRNIKAFLGKRFSLSAAVARIFNSIQNTNIDR